MINIAVAALAGIFVILTTSDIRVLDLDISSVLKVNAISVGTIFR